jgi:hypothetical protein
MFCSTREQISVDRSPDEEYKVLRLESFLPISSDNSYRSIHNS